MRIVKTVVALALIAGLCSVAAAQDGTTSSQKPKLSAEQQAIKQNAEAFVKAFNKADARAIAALFAPNGHMSHDGNLIAEGRKAIEKEYLRFFKENPGIKISVTIDSMKLIGPNLAIEKGTSQTTSADSAIEDAYTLVHTRRNGVWLTATADVVSRPAAPAFDWKKELAFLEGKWAAEAKGWRVMTSVEWVSNGNFLKRTFEVINNGKVESKGLQVIGWDARNRSVTSWEFGADGGHGRGWWSRDGDNWVIKSEGTTSSGEVIKATNVITILGKNEFRWQSSGRSLDGVSLTDTDSVRVRRLKKVKTRKR